MASQRCEDCEAVIVGGQCVICGWTPKRASDPGSLNRDPSVPGGIHGRSIAGPSYAPPSADQEKRIRGLLHDLTQKFTPTSQQRPLPVQEHARRFIELGLTQPRAFDLATAMAEDPAHRSQCAICQRHAITQVSDGR